MSQVRRLYVEKKPGFDGEAQALCRDLRHQLGLKGLTGVRILVRYDVAGMEEDDYAKACVSIFSEPMVDQIFHEELPEGMGQAFAREYLPGQYDQRADSAAQCVQLLTQGARPQVRVATVYGLTGELTGDQLEAVKGYLINPVDSCQGPMEKFDTLDMVLDTPEDVKVM
ncbi:MAG: phosphoribosylformylglycinamidine synthase, partial [Christensenellaceae bacterium]